MLIERGEIISLAPFPVYDESRLDPTASPAARAPKRMPCRDTTGHDESDLCAQWRAARAAETSAAWAEWASVGGIVSTVAVLIALYMTLDANRIARDTAARQLRAYVSIGTVKISALTIGQVPMFTANFKNFGQTPAHGFVIISFAAYITAAVPDPDLPVLALTNAPSS